MGKPFRVVFFPSIEAGTEPFIQGFLTLDQAKSAFDAVANYTLHLHDTKLMPDHSNTGAIEQLVNGDWVNVEELV